MRQLTVRGVPDDVADRLASIAGERGQSLNKTVVEILEKAVGAGSQASWLDRYVTWTDEDVAEFEEGLAVQRVIDPELWR